jgi:hypothetical protein
MLRGSYIHGGFYRKEKTTGHIEKGEDAVQIAA